MKRNVRRPLIGRLETLEDRALLSGASPTAVPDPYTLGEDGTLTTTAVTGVLANDTDPELDVLTAALDVGPANGSLTLNPDGSFVYTPTANFNGVDTFTYHANDGTSDSLPTTVTLTVTAVNDPPVAVADAYAATEDTPLTVPAITGVLANDIDVDADPLTAILDVGPVNGTLALSPDGSFVYTPGANFNGVDTFTYHANDGTIDSVPTLVTITAAAVNDPPVAVADAYAATEDTVLTVPAITGVLANDIDVDGNPLTAILDVGPVNGTLALSPDGSFVYTPGANFNGVDTFTYHANDGAIDSVPTVVTITAAAVNDPPVAVADAYAATEDTVLTVPAITGVLANDIDIDGDTLTAILDVGPVNGTLALSPDGSFVYTPGANFNGVDTFTYHANDGTLSSAPTLVTITAAAVNDPPVAVADAYTAPEDSVLTVTAATGVLANDIDVEGNPLTAILDVSPVSGTLTLNPDGSFVYTPGANFNGVDTFTYHANDGTNNSVPAVVTLTTTAVNDPPVGVADAYGTTEDTPLIVNAATGVLANDIDLDGDTLTAVLDLGPLNGTLVLNQNGSFTYTPNANSNGADSFTYHANDGTANSPTTLVTLTTTAVNDVPVAVADAYTVTEDTPFIVTAATGVLANDIDLDGDTLTAILDVGPTSGTLTLNPNGSFTYTPNANFNGVDTFTYHANDGTADSVPAVVTLTTTSVNDVPVGVADAYSATEDTPLIVNAATGVLANDIDLDGDTLTAVLDVGPTSGTLVLNQNGSFTYTPNANSNGVDSFTYHANDGTADSLTTLVTLTTAAVNDPPVAVADAYAVTEDVPFTVTAATGVLANDIDLDADTLTAILNVGPSNGTLTLNANGSFTYTPNANFNGVDTFTYHANDGTANSAPAVVTLTVASVNDTPVAVADAYTTAEDTPLTVLPATGVLVNDTDADGNPLVAAIATGPANGTVVVAPNGSFVYTPNANFNGIDTFTYTASDGVATSAPATVTITVTASNDAPVAVADAYSGTEDTPLTVNAANGVLANDTDADGNALTASLVTGPTNGVVVLNPNGSFTYTPTANFNGTDTFTYMANDGTANSSVATVTLTVAGANDLPVSANDSYFINENAVLVVPSITGVLANDTDADGDPMTATVVTAPQNGTLVLNADGSFTYTPNILFSGTDTFTYHANDGTGNGNDATVTITVVAVDLPPVIITSAGTTEAGHKKTVVDPAVNLIDLDSLNFGGGHLDVAVQSGGSGHDFLGYKHGGARKGLVNVRAGQLRVGTTAIGSITGGKKGTPIHVEFNSNASQELVETAMQSVLLKGCKRHPGTRVVSFQITDDTGLDSNVATKNVDVS